LEAATLKTVYSDARFWRIAALSATSIGSPWALQFLWAAPWVVVSNGWTEQDYFRPELVGRANSAMWLGPVVQYGTGLILEQSPLEAGHSPLIATGSLSE